MQGKKTQQSWQLILLQIKLICNPLSTMNNVSPHPHPGPPARHSDGRLPAVHPEHLRRDPLPQDDLVGGNRRRHRDFHHRLHVLCHSECVTCLLILALRIVADLVCPEISRSHFESVNKLDGSILLHTWQQREDEVMSCAAVKRYQMFTIITFTEGSRDWRIKRGVEQSSMANWIYHSYCSIYFSTESCSGLSHGAQCCKSISSFIMTLLGMWWGTLIYEMFPSLNSSQKNPHSHLVILPVEGFHKCSAGAFLHHEICRCGRKHYI